MQILITHDIVYLKQSACHFPLHWRSGFGSISKLKCGLVVKELTDLAGISQGPFWIRHESVAVEYMALYRRCGQMCCLQVQLL